MKLEDLFKENKGKGKIYLSDIAKNNKFIARHLESRNVLYEGLIMSADNDKIQSLLQKAKIDFSYVDGQYYYKLDINKPLTDEKANKLKQILSISGWYVSTPKDKDSSGFNQDWWYEQQIYMGSNFIPFTLEPKFDIELSVRNIPDVMYHVAPKKFRDKIIANGLLPKSKTKKANHPERLYLATSERAVRMIDRSFSTLDKEERDVWVIHKKDVEGRKFYMDRNFISYDQFRNEYVDGIYTLDPIGPFQISLAS